MVLKETHSKILNCLRKNSRSGFSDISRVEGIPVTTVFDNYDQLMRSGIVRKHILLLDFRNLGYNYRSFIFLKVQKRNELLAHLKGSRFVNSIYKVSGADYMVDAVFPAIKEFYLFLEELDGFGVLSLEHHNVIEPLKLEEFKVN
jgi:DNA-binding Lrp family transcriptional regulator